MFERTKPWRHSNARTGLDCAANVIVDIALIAALPFIWYEALGGAVHVMFGAPMEQADHAARAVAGALEMDQAAQA